MTGWRRVIAELLLWAGLCATLPVNGSALASPAYRRWLLGAALVTGVAVLVWRRYPLVALGIGIALVAADLALAGPLVVLAFLVGRYAAADRSALWTFFGLTCLATIAAGFAHTDPWTGFYVVAEVLFGGVFPWLVGRYRRHRRALVAGGWERAAQLEQAQAAAVERARMRERARIAQDLHDVLGHELSLLALRAGALELDTSLEERQRAVAAELRAGAATATERLREAVGVLGPGSASLQPFDESVAALVARSAAAGLDADLQLTDVGALPPLADRAVYRVVQEGLTNAARHASGEPVSVRVVGTDAEVTVTVANPFTGPPAAPGSGLVGLAERVRLAGGSLRAGIAAEGFMVRATLPRAERPEPLPPADVPVQLERARRRTRRSLGRAVAVPVVAGVVLLGTVIGGYVVQVEGSVLPAAAAAKLRVGTPERELDLPVLQIGDRPDVVEPTPPSGASCRYYAADRRLFSPGRDVYRLCFAARKLAGVELIRGDGPRPDPGRAGR